MFLAAQPALADGAAQVVEVAAQRRVGRGLVHLRPEQRGQRIAAVGLIFADLRDEEMQELAACLGKRAFARDMILFHKGSPSQALYLIESGAVRAFALSETGQEITLDVYGPGDCFGETALLDGQMDCAPLRSEY